MPKGLRRYYGKRRSTFRDIQLSSKIAATGNRASAKSLREGTGASSNGVRIPACRFCGDAESRALADERAAEGNAVHRDKDVEAENFPEDEEKKQTARG